MKIHLIWIILTEGLPFTQSYTSSLCFRQSHYASTICNGRYHALFCNHGEVIMINTIRYAKNGYKDGSCRECLKNETMSAWEIDPTLFKNTLYLLCSQQNNCSFDEEVEIPSPDERERRYLWKAIILYDCVSSGLINDTCSPWEAALREGLDVTVQSKTDDKDSTPKTNSLTPARPTRTTSNGSSSEVFPSPIIAGASVGLVALVSVILTVYLLHRRRSRRMPEPRRKEAIYYNETHFAVEQPEESRTDGGTKRAHENGDELYVNISNCLPQDQESNNVYLNMVHQALHEPDAEYTEKSFRNIQNRNENRLYDIEESYYNNSTRADESESNYCKLNRTDEDMHEYNYLTGINNG